MFVSRRVPPTLAPFVEALWFYESHHTHTREVVLPSGRSQLLVNLEGEAMVRGASTRATAIDPTRMRRMVGVLFRAGGTALVSGGVPALDLQDVGVDLADLSGSEAHRLTDRLCGAEGSEAMLDELAGWLVGRRATCDGELRGMAAAAGWLEGGMPVADAIERLGMSRSRFVRRFGAYVGTTPKVYAGVARFQRVVSALAGGERDLAALAVRCGYYDQAHLTHAFRRFSGRTPGAYRPRDPREPNHVID